MIAGTAFAVLFTAALLVVPTLPGIDKPGVVSLAPGKTRIRDLVGARVVPFTHFALLANEYMNRYGATAEQVAQVAVKNNRNGASNPYAQRQRAVTLEEVMAGPPISGTLTRLQCCPVGEGAAAVIVASDVFGLPFGSCR